MLSVCLGIAKAKIENKYLESKNPTIFGEEP